MTQLQLFRQSLKRKVKLLCSLNFLYHWISTSTSRILSNRKHIRFRLCHTLGSLNQPRIFLRKHLSLLLPRLNGHKQALLCKLILMLNIITIFSFNIFLQLRCSRVIIVEWDTYPRELYPYPSFVVVEGRFYLSESVVLFYFLEGVGSQRMGDSWHYSRGLVDIQVASFISAWSEIIFFFLDKLLYIFEVVLSKFIPIHRYIDVQLFDLTQYFGILIFLFEFGLRVLQISLDLVHRFH